MTIVAINGQHTTIREAADRISAVTDLVVFIDTQNNRIGLRLEWENKSKTPNYITVIKFR